MITPETFPDNEPSENNEASQTEKIEGDNQEKLGQQEKIPPIKEKLKGVAKSLLGGETKEETIRRFKSPIDRVSLEGEITTFKGYCRLVPYQIEDKTLNPNDFYQIKTKKGEVIEVIYKGIDLNRDPVFERKTEEIKPGPQPQLKEPQPEEPQPEEPQPEEPQPEEPQPEEPQPEEPQPEGPQPGEAGPTQPETQSGAGVQALELQEPPTEEREVHKIKVNVGDVYKDEEKNCYYVPISINPFIYLIVREEGGRLTTSADTTSSREAMVEKIVNGEAKILIPKIKGDQLSALPIPPDVRRDEVERMLYSNIVNIYIKTQVEPNLKGSERDKAAEMKKIKTAILGNLQPGKEWIEKTTGQAVKIVHLTPFRVEFSFSDPETGEEKTRKSGLFAFLRHHHAPKSEDKGPETYQTEEKIIPSTKEGEQSIEKLGNKGWIYDPQKKEFLPVQEDEIAVKKEPYQDIEVGTLITETFTTDTGEEEIFAKQYLGTFTDETGKTMLVFKFLPELKKIEEIPEGTPHFDVEYLKEILT